LSKGSGKGFRLFHAASSPSEEAAWKGAPHFAFRQAKGLGFRSNYTSTSKGIVIEMENAGAIIERLL